ncbi:hypothetical protein [Homoserinibacter sp. YIM 151385]|uniref:hypothetical protein n=1 Tax=Homoserinibacter sp. YIM 151385 TaxID=2985506 RepID=UPI0022F0B934|nr:hypothetical protein [Homoserinibacter sp. YIM 151385]WBU38273.1 hypothetical protein OF852_01430 [Homoserinibacter sp. YIM 151385]
MAALPRLLAVVAAPLLLLPLAACVPGAAPGPGGSGAPEPSASSEPGPGESAAPAPTERPAGPAALRISCEQLVPAELVYGFNPNFALLDDWTPETGSPGAAALAADGTACRWQHESSADTIDVAVAQPGPDAGLLRGAIAGTAVPGLGEEASFARVGRVALLDVVAGSARVSVASTYLESAADARPLAEAALDALP